MMSGICSVCGLPGELCICQEIAKEQQCAILSTDRRRYGKIVTKVYPNNVRKFYKPHESLTQFIPLTFVEKGKELHFIQMIMVL